MSQSLELFRLDFAAFVTWLTYNYLLIYKYVIIISISDRSKLQIKLNMVGLKANIAYVAMSKKC